MDEIKNILKKFQDAYINRDLERIDSFVEEVFLDSDDISILGTATEEVFFGKSKVKELIEGDFKYWGDLNLDCENANITIHEDVAWFFTDGTVKYVFKDDEGKDDRYLEFIKNKLQDNTLTEKQRISFINWALTLAYNKRSSSERKYLWPMCLSGFLIKADGRWKIYHLQFSMTKSNFPDERFENSLEFKDSYDRQRDIIKNNRTKELDNFMKDFSKDVIGNPRLSKMIISKYFNNKKVTIISPENKYYKGEDEIYNYLTTKAGENLDLEIENINATKVCNYYYIMATGLLKVCMEEKELINRCFNEVEKIESSTLNSREKLFKIQRSIAASLKEIASEEIYTFPIRMTAVIEDNKDNMMFNFIHFSFPYYWTLEGKVDC